MWLSQPMLLSRFFSILKNCVFSSQIWNQDIRGGPPGVGTSHSSFLVEAWSISKSIFSFGIEKKQRKKKRGGNLKSGRERACKCVCVCDCVWEGGNGMKVLLSSQTISWHLRVDGGKKGIPWKSCCVCSNKEKVMPKAKRTFTETNQKVSILKDIALESQAK